VVVVEVVTTDNLVKLVALAVAVVFIQELLVLPHQDKVILVALVAQAQMLLAVVVAVRALLVILVNRAV
jgi:hypothetical protein